MNAILAITSLSVLFGLCLSVAAKYFRVDSDPVIDHIEALLPQTQCAQCNYPGCRPYAEAIASGEASINQCPPGGTDLIHALAELLGRDAIPLNPENGMETPIHHVRIVEADCIGCTLCIQACPVDAILGASQQMHTVIESECTGCDLCLPPCPVDCIEVVTQCTPEQGSQAA
jgi:electron transport complex protein RnfB